MIILDTNVVSESIKEVPDPQFMRWSRTLSPSSTFLTVITTMELWRGIMQLPEGRRKDDLTAMISVTCDHNFAGHVLSVDEASAKICGALLADNIRRGRNAPLPDVQIAAIAIAHGFALATRNVKVFEYRDLPVIDPWEAY